MGHAVRCFRFVPRTVLFCPFYDVTPACWPRPPSPGVRLCPTWPPLNRQCIGCSVVIACGSAVSCSGWMRRRRGGLSKLSPAPCPSLPRRWHLCRVPYRRALRRLGDTARALPGPASGAVAGGASRCRSASPLALRRSSPSSRWSNRIWEAAGCFEDRSRDEARKARAKVRECERAIWTPRQRRDCTGAHSDGEQRPSAAWTPGCKCLDELHAMLPPGLDRDRVCSTESPPGCLEWWWS